MADEDAFDAFVAARGPSLWRTAWLLTGDHHGAEDLVQTALAKAWPHFDRVENFEAYVRRTMVNTHIAWWRRRWTQEIPFADAGSAQVHEDALKHPDLMAALARLPRAQRTVLVLRYFDGLTERETAEQIAVSVGTVKSHASRAIAALRASSMLSIQEHL